MNTVVDGKAIGAISSDQVNSEVGVNGGTSTEKRGCFNFGWEKHQEMSRSR